jgi:hypothetical protein
MAFVIYGTWRYFRNQEISRQKDEGYRRRDERWKRGEEYPPPSSEQAQSEPKQSLWRRYVKM